MKTERRAPLVKITANFSEERNVSVSKRTVRRRLRDHGFSRNVCRKKVVVKFNNRNKNDWHGVWRKCGGQLSTNGVKLYLVTSHKFVLGRSSVYLHGETRRRVETGIGVGENGPQVQCYGVGCIC